MSKKKVIKYVLTQHPIKYRENYQEEQKIYLSMLKSRKLPANGSQYKSHNILLKCASSRLFPFRFYMIMKINTIWN